MRYFLSYLLIVGLILTPIIYAHSEQPKFNPNPKVTAEGEDKFDHGRFFEVKDAVKTAIEYSAKRYGGEEYNEEKLKGFVADTSKILDSLKAEYSTIEYAVIGDPEINAPGLLERGNMFVTTVVEYKDEKDSVIWEFQTVFSINAVDFYVVVQDGKPKSFDDYYHYNHLQKKVKKDDGHKDS